MLAGLIQAESALHAITRDWRYDAAARAFVRLHRLLGEQLAEIGLRLGRLAARNRDLGAWHRTGPGDRMGASRAEMPVGALQTYMVADLLKRHETLVVSLKRGRAITGGRLADTETDELLATLALEHERDAFMLRALLWELENPAA